MSPVAALAWALGGLLGFALLVLGVWRLCVPGSQIAVLPPAGAGVLQRPVAAGLARRRGGRDLFLDLERAEAAAADGRGWPPTARWNRSAIRRSSGPARCRSWQSSSATCWRGPCRRRSPPWVLPAIAFVPPALLLWWTVQPIGEARGYGRLFFLLFLAWPSRSPRSPSTVSSGSGADTLRVLQRLDNASPAVAEAFEAISEELRLAADQVVRLADPAVPHAGPLRPASCGSWPRPARSAVAGYPDVAGASP